MSKGLPRFRTARGAVVALVLLSMPAAVHAMDREVLSIGHAQTVEVAAGEVLVRFHHQLPSAEIEKRIDSLGARALSWDRELGLVRLKIPDTESLADFIASHEGDAEIISLEPNPLVMAMADKAAAPNDPLFPKQWGLRKIGVTKAWAMTVGSEGMVIAVLDTGVDETHADLEGQLLQGYNVLAPTESPADDNGHGTAIAGILAAEANNDFGIAGTCRKCRLLPVKVLDENGEGTYADLIKGILWAVHQGARVINLSLGGTVESQALQDAVDYARSRGAVLVAAGGNSGEKHPIYPAAYGSVIGVGATDSRDHAWAWSGRGPHIRLTAPGVGVWTLAPADQFARITGTSAAAAHVSGVVALLLSRDGTLSPAEIEQSLYSSVDDLGPLGRDATYGFGRLNARKAFLARPNRAHDVNLAGIRIEPSTFQVGNTIQVRATISNEGAFVEEALEVSLSINRVPLAELRIEALGPGEQQDVLFDWKSVLPDTGEIVVAARVKAVPGELDSTDNERFQRYGFSEEGEIVSLYAVEPPVHQWIALQAYNKLSSGQLKTELGQYLPTSSSSAYYSSSFNPYSYGWPNNTNSYAFSSAALIEGIWEEDNPETRVLEHFWLPEGGYDAGLFTYHSALKIALEDRFFTALLVYNTDKAASYYWLGRTVHLLEDMSVPAHTLLDVHPPWLDVDSDNYEHFTAEDENYRLITSSSANTTIPDVKSLPSYPYQVPTDDLTKIFYSLADKANDFDSDDADGQSSQYGKGKFHLARNTLATGKTVSKVEYWSPFSKIRDLTKTVDYDVIQNSCEYRIYYYRSFYDQINNTINSVKVIYTDGTSIFFANLDESASGVFEEVLRCIQQRELEARAIGHVAALYQLFWDRTHAVRWSSGSPPSTMISGQNYSVSWIVASGNSISHTNVHWDTDPVRLKTTSALGSTFNECSSPCSPRTFTNSISSNPIVAPAPGAYYFVAHARIDGLDAWSDIVSVTVLPSSPTIGRSPATMTFSGVQGGSNPASQTLGITNTGGGTLSWSVSDNASWLNLSPSSGTTTTEIDSVTVSVGTSGLGPGSYSATITISAAGATNTPQTVAVSLTVSPASPTIGRSPATMSFSGSNPASQTLSITNTGGGTLSWSLSDNASWLNLTPTSGTTTTETDSITVSVNSSGLGPGNYSATITISAAGSTNTPQTVAVSLTIGGVNPAIGRNPASMSFSGIVGGANPGSQTLSITNTGGGTLSWSLSDNASWLNLTPTSGTTTTEIDSVTVSVNSSGLGPGNYSATITISAPGATNTPQTVSVSFALSGGGSPAQGFFLDFRRQGCSGGGPAVLLWWTAPAGMSNVFTVRRTDGGYTATVNSSQGGMLHLVSSLLDPGETYSFYVEGILSGATVQTNAVTVPVISDECRLPVGAGELPHLPLLWAGPSFCSGGTASVPLQWTAVGGAASYTLTRIDNVAALLTPYPNLTGTSLTDSGLLPGAQYEYMLEAFGSGGARLANRITVFVPSGICSEPSTPGPFSAQVSAPVCDAGKGALTLSWTPASGAASKINTYWSDDGFTSGSGSTFTGSSHYIDGIRPGALVKLMVQAEAASTPNLYRNVIMSQRIPLDICGAGTLTPTVTTFAASYIQEQQALLRAAIIPNAGSAIAFFEWGASASYGSTTPLRNAGDGYRSASLGETLTGLACNTTYYFRVHATNPVGQTTGVSSSFTTLPCSNVVCYPLFRSVNDPSGGGLPVPSPSQSPGCPSGEYTAGQPIQVSASPSAGWQVGNWTGTQNNSSASTSNTVSMPAGNHFVHVNYVHPIDSTTPLSFYTLAPCRLIDTRQTVSPLRSGAGPLRTVPVTGVCGVPVTARAVSINITAVNPTGAGFIILFPADQLQPGTSSLNFGAAQTRANNAVLALSASGLLGAVAGIAANDQVDLIIDVNGYFGPDL